MCGILRRLFGTRNRDYRKCQWIPAVKWKREERGHKDRVQKSGRQDVCHGGDNGKNSTGNPDICKVRKGIWRTVGHSHAALCFPYQGRGNLWILPAAEWRSGHSRGHSELCRAGGDWDERRSVVTNDVWFWKYPVYKGRNRKGAPDDQ